MRRVAWTSHWRVCTRALAAACLAAAWALAAIPAARGEDDEAVDDARGVQQMQQQQQEQWVDLGANFDQNVLQQQGGGFAFTHGRRRRPSPSGGDGDQTAESPTLSVVCEIADKRLARIDEACGFSEGQRRKLRMAMESDIRRLVDAMDVERRKYTGVAVNLNDEAGQRKWNEFQQDVERCRQGLQALFDSESLFAKVVPTTLDEPQLAKLLAETKVQRAYRWKTIVVAALLEIDDTLGLDQTQYDSIERLLLENEPPLRLDGHSPGRQRQDLHAQQMLVYMVLSEVDGKRLQGAVSERQWKTLSQLANQGKAMRSFIEQQGILER